MATKPKKVGTVEHPRSGIVVDYFLEGTLFVATVLEKKITAPEASVLRALINDKLEHWITMQWFPIIEVECEGGDRDSGKSLSLEASRYYISRSPAGVVYKVDWDCDEVHRKAKMNRCDSEALKLTKLPIGAPMQASGGRYNRSDNHLIDYSDEVWDALQSIMEGIGQLAQQIQKLVKTREGVKKLAASGTKVLLLKQ